MAKTEVYSLRLDPEVKMGLEEAARFQGVTVAELLDRAARRVLEEWRSKRDDDDAEQARINAAAAKAIGAIAAGPDFSQNVSAKIRAHLRQRYARKRSA